MAYPPYMAAALSGATIRQLAHWRRGARTGPVLKPEFSSTRPILYSFRDVVALRTCVFLRKESSLQKIRTALGNLKNLGELGHLSEHKLVAGNSSIVLISETEAIDLVKHPGQRVIAEMSDVLRPFLNRAEVEIPALKHPREHISVDPGVKAGYPVIVGTRVPYDNVAGLLADGVPAEDIADYYPAVSASAARDALDFASYVDQWRSRKLSNIGAA